MSERLTNNHGLSLAMSIWLAHEEYTNGADQFPGEDVISATSLLKPPKQIILGNRVPINENKLDVMDLFSNAHGHALHDSIEKAWMNPQRAMERMGYPKKIREAVVVNPDPAEVQDEQIPVYLERRGFKRINVDRNSFVISGKFDQVIDGQLNDTKKTGVYSYISGSKEKDYRVQGSIYRWLNPDLITSNEILIQFIFTDWKAGDVKRIKGYPPTPVYEFKVQLMTLGETEYWIKKRIRHLVAEQNLPQNQITPCNDEELWMTKPVYKYYMDPKKANDPKSRASKVSNDLAELTQHRISKGKGVIVTIPGEAKACKYCKASAICDQAKELRK